MDRRLEVLVILIEHKTSALGDLDGTPQPFDLLLHLGMFGPLADALEVGLNLALEFKPIAARATLEGFLDDIAAQLRGDEMLASSSTGATRLSQGGKKVGIGGEGKEGWGTMAGDSIRNSVPFAGGTRCMHASRRADGDSWSLVSHLPSPRVLALVLGHGRGRQGCRDCCQWCSVCASQWTKRCR